MTLITPITKDLQKIPKVQNIKTSKIRYLALLELSVIIQDQGTVCIVGYTNVLSIDYYFNDHDDLDIEIISANRKKLPFSSTASQVVICTHVLRINSTL